MNNISRREVIALLGGGVAGIALGSNHAWAQGKSGGTVVIPFIGNSPNGLNPAIAVGFATRMPGTQLFASPVRYDSKWQPQPYLAKSWEVAPDGLSLTLHLVEGATFHDGKPITSEDVAYSLMALKEYHPSRRMFDPITEVETPDPGTAVIRMANPNPALLMTLSPGMCPILPKHIYGDGTDLRVHPANNAPIGSGPFRLAEFRPGEHVILDRYDGFFIAGRPALDRIIYQVFNDQASALLAMERGDAHLLGNLNSPLDSARLARNPSLVVTDDGYTAMGAITRLAFNLLKEPLKDKRVRHAICYAVNRDFILKNILQGAAKPATGPIAPGSPFYSDAVEQYAMDLDKANQLLDEAGHPRGTDGMRFKLTLDYPIGVGDVIKSTAEYLRPQLRKIGIDVEVRTSPDFATWSRRVSSFEFDITLDSLLNWGDPVIGVEKCYVTNNIRKGVIWSNTQNYSNPKVDQILADAAKEMDIEKRKALYLDFQKIVVDDAPVFYINITPFVTCYNKKLEGMTDSIWGFTAEPMDEMHWADA